MRRGCLHRGHRQRTRGVTREDKDATTICEYQYITRDDISNDIIIDVQATRPVPGTFNALMWRLSGRRHAGARGSNHPGLIWVITVYQNYQGKNIESEWGYEWGIESELSYEW